MERRRWRDRHAVTSPACGWRKSPARAFRRWRRARMGRAGPSIRQATCRRLVEAARGLPSLRLLVLDPVVSGSQATVTRTPRRGAGCSLSLTWLGNSIAACWASRTCQKEHQWPGAAGACRGVDCLREPWRASCWRPSSRPTQTNRGDWSGKSNIGPDSGGFAYTLFGAIVPGHELQRPAH